MMIKKEETTIMVIVVEMVEEMAVEMVEETAVETVVETEMIIIQKINHITMKISFVCIHFT
jgi:hypothetical protein